MRFLLQGALLAVLVCASTSSARALEPWRNDSPIQAPSVDAEDLSQARREAIILDIDQTIRRRFAHWQGVPGLDYDAAFAAYRAEALAAPDRAAFSRRTRAFVAALDNGHTVFHDPSIYEGDPGGLGLALARLDAGWTVIRSRRPEVPAGSVISTLDGASFDTFYRNASAQLSASSARARESALSRFPYVFPTRFSLTLADGRTVDIDRSQPPSGPTPQPAPPVSHRWITPDEVAYLKITTFSDPVAERDAQTAMRDVYARARIVILDVRGNGGGTTPSRLGRQLLGGHWRSWRSAAPSAAAPVAPRTRPASPRYIVLVDRDCASACEDFVMPFSLAPNAVLVGETTTGSSGQPAHVEWEGGMQLWVGARRQWFPDGRPFEGVGVRPDIVLDPQPADFMAGATDRVAACATRLSQDPGATC